MSTSTVYAEVFGDRKEGRPRQARRRDNLNRITGMRGAGGSGGVRWEGGGDGT